MELSAADYTEGTQSALAVMAARGQTGRRPADVRQARADTAVAALAGPPPSVASVTATAIPGPAGPLALRVYRPTDDGAPGPGLVYFHGGGFVLGGPESHNGALRALANTTQHVVVAVDYRLAPEHPFPAAVLDADAATRHVAARAEEFSIDPARLSVAGDSAGATLAAVAAQLCRTQGGPNLVHQVLITPLTLWPPKADTLSRRELADGYYLTGELLDWYAECYVPDVADRTDPRAAPALAPDLSGLPAATVITAGLDPLRNEGEQYARAMRAAGVDVRVRRLRGAFHLLWLATQIAPAAQAEVFALLRERLSSSWLNGR
ncbi:alpha/beta hydrolase [Streptomyces spinoverrucosus]|uniref:alpha/beta hydrolase n=1 Tax=Streptomyces spinoverrucosus TaxID=284043 RepID=UPI00142EA80C|nr:alpha/beta hydrolase [Streptomyces spinoverrucosus]